MTLPLLDRLRRRWRDRSGSGGLAFGPALVLPDQCRCRHVASEHEHYRPGSDCGRCTCPSWDG